MLWQTPGLYYQCRTEMLAYLFDHSHLFIFIDTERHFRCHFLSFCWNLQSGGLSLSFIKAWRVNSDPILHVSINGFPEQRSLFSVSPQAEWDLMNHQAQHLVECDKHVALSVVLLMWNLWKHLSHDFKEALIRIIYWILLVGWFLIKYVERQCN